MARPLRVDYEGAIYHVTLRGNGRMDIFHDDRDRERFLDRLADGVETHGVRLNLFCLMTNHVHLVVETPHANLSAFMHQLQTAYTVYFNLRHRHSGHLTQGRFGGALVEGDEYLLNLTRYVHLNPAYVGTIKTLPLEQRVKHLRAYRWSSYRSYIGKEKPLDFMAIGPILAMMPGKASGRRSEYRKFVEEGIAETDDEFVALMKDARLSIGGEAFRDWVSDVHFKLIGKQRRREDAAFRRVGKRLEVEAVLAAVCETLGCAREAVRERRRHGWVRPVAAKMLNRFAGLTQREIADVMGLESGVAVSRQLGRLRAAMESQKQLCAQVKTIESKLVGMSG